MNELPDPRTVSLGEDPAIMAAVWCGVHNAPVDWADGVKVTMMRSLKDDALLLAKFLRALVIVGGEDELHVFLRAFVNA